MQKGLGLQATKAGQWEGPGMRLGCSLSQTWAVCSRFLSCSFGDSFGENLSPKLQDEIQNGKPGFKGRVQWHKSNMEWIIKVRIVS